jgi:hypothetical protein
MHATQTCCCCCCCVSAAQVLHTLTLQQSLHCAYLCGCRSGKVTWGASECLQASKRADRRANHPMRLINHDCSLQSCKTTCKGYSDCCTVGHAVIHTGMHSQLWQHHGAVKNIISGKTQARG